MNRLLKKSFRHDVGLWLVAGFVVAGFLLMLQKIGGTALYSPEGNNWFANAFTLVVVFAYPLAFVMHATAILILHIRHKHRKIIRTR